MKLNVCLLVFSLLAVFTSCNRENERESKASLYSAAQVMEYDPVEAQHRLKTVRKISLPDADYAYYVLVKARVAERNGVNIAPLAETVAEARDFFEKEGEASKVAFAHFVLAKVYEAQQNAAKELYYYMQADDWAGKANNQLPNFSYSSIPYNIALCLYDNRHYEESLQYLEKALSHTDSNEPSQLHDKMFFLELKATNYQMLAGEDSALYYYDLALDLARQFKDAPAENRILFNKYALLYNTEKYEMAEKRCKELLPQLLESRDSLHLGKTNIILARIYAKSDRLDSASTSIGKAVAFLENAKGDARLSLYETLTLVEQKKGNHAKANGYQRQYNEYKTQLEDKRRTEQAELAKLEEVRRQEGEQLALSLIDSSFSRDFQKNIVKNNVTLILIVMSCLILGVLLTMVFIDGGELFSSLRFDLSADKRDPDVAMARLTKGELLRWTARSEEVRMVMQGAERKCPSDDRMVRISYMVDDLVPPDDWNWRRLSPSANCSYAELMGMLRRDFPQLEEKELEICTLLYTQRLKARQVADIIQLELPQFKEQRKSMKHKLREAGYTSGCIRKYVRNCVYNSSDILS